MIGFVVLVLVLVLVSGIEHSAFLLATSPGHFIFHFYFELRSNHGVTKLPRPDLTFDVPASVIQSARNTGLHHYAWLLLFFKD